MHPIENVCCFTGHRPKYFSFGIDEQHPDCLAVKAFLREKCRHLIREGVTHFLSGGAVGVDTWAMEEVIGLQAEHPHVTLECVLPYAGMPARFAPPDRERFARIAPLLQAVTVLGTGYRRGCMQHRNEYMADRARYCIAVWTGRKSGTANTLGYAGTLGRKVFCLKLGKDGNWRETTDWTEEA